MADHKTIKEVLDLLKKKGVEIDAVAAEAARDTYGGLVFTDPENLPKEGQIIVAESDHKELKSDMMKWKKNARTHEERVKELEESIESGQNLLKKERDQLREENKGLRPVVEAYKEEKRKEWEENREKIPEKLHPFYAFPAEDEKLSDDQILANVKKLAEHRSIGVLEVEEPGEEEKTPEGFRKPSGGGGSKRGKDEWRGLPREGKMAAGYDKVDRREGDMKKESGA